MVKWSINNSLFFRTSQGHLKSLVVLVTQLCLILCDSMDCSPPGSSIHGILQARILELAATSYSKEFSQPKNQTHIACVFCNGRQILEQPGHLWNPEFSSVQLSSFAQLCLTLCNPMDCSTPGLPVHHQLPEFIQTHVHWVNDAI